MTSLKCECEVHRQLPTTYVGTYMCCMYVQATVARIQTNHARMFYQAKLRMSSVQRSSDTGRERVNDVKEGIQIVELAEAST